MADRSSQALALISTTYPRPFRDSISLVARALPGAQAVSPFVRTPSPVFLSPHLRDGDVRRVHVRPLQPGPPLGTAPTLLHDTPQVVQWRA
jgi:hypothetical protein